MRPRSADVLAQDLALMTDLPDDIRKQLEDLVKEAKKQAGRPFADTVYIVGVSALGIVVVLAVVLLGVLALRNVEAPEAIATLAATAIGGLVGLFAPSPVATSSD